MCLDYSRTNEHIFFVCVCGGGGGGVRVCVGVCV